MPEIRIQPNSPRRGTADDPEEIQSMHDVFSNWERRAILYYLREREQPATVESIARHLVGWRRGFEEPAPDDDDAVELVRGRVVHAHLMEMTDFGILAYDARSDRVRLCDDMKVSVSPPWEHHDEAIGRETENDLSESGSTGVATDG